MIRNATATSVGWKDPSRILLAVSVIAMSVYVLLRSAYVSFTHDEAFTFLNYILKPIDVTLDVTYTNNHLLNSLLMRWCNSMFGSSELSLRLPNVLGGILFFVYGARLLARLPAGKWFAPIAFIGLTFNPFMLEFFGMARGYGIGTGLLMASLYHQYMSFAEERTTRHEWMATVFSVLALLAFYTLINFFLIQVVINVYRMVYKLIRNKPAGFNRWFSVVSFAVFIAGVVQFLRYFIEMMLRLNELGSLNFGGQTGMWNDCVGPVVGMSCFSIRAGGIWDEPIYAFGGVAVLLLAAFVCARMFLRKEWNALNRFTLFGFLAIAGCGVAIYIQHRVLAIPYPENRTILYFIPLFSLLAISLAAQTGKLKLISGALAFLFLFPVVLAQSSHFNLHHALYWPSDSGMDKATLAVIEEAKQMDNISRPRYVLVPFDVSKSFAYYVYRNKAYNLQPVYVYQSTWLVLADIALELEAQPVFNSEFPYQMKEQVENLRIWVKNNPAKASQGTVLGSFDFENNEADKRFSLPGNNSRYADKLDPAQIYSRFVADTIDSTYKHGTVYLLKFQMMSPHFVSKTAAVMTVSRGATPIMWTPIDLAPYVQSTGTWVDIAVVHHADIELQPGDQIGFYIANDWNEATAVDNFSVTRFDPEQ